MRPDFGRTITEIEKGELLNRAELSSTVAESKTPKFSIFHFPFSILNSPFRGI